jgi:anti-sigma regulatory factor (Ser/Thr protein kinase)
MAESFNMPAEPGTMGGRQQVRAMSEFAYEYPLSPAAPVAARRAVRRLDAIASDRLPDVLILISELVTNAVRHGAVQASSVRVRIDVSPERIRLEVEDDGVGEFRPATVPRDGAGGLGLRLVESLSDRWGIARTGPTVVWCELDTH